MSFSAAAAADAAADALNAAAAAAARPPAKVTWVTLYTVPPVPFQNHYIVLDSRTNAPSKCYRIVVSP
jgi:hypothetical protein